MMKRLTVLLLITFSTFAAAWAQDSLFDQTYSRFLNSFVEAGHVDYARIKRDSKELDAVIDQIQRVDLDSLQSRDEEAFLINAYNALVISAVVKHYPIHSTRDVPGFFDEEKHLIGGRYVTLDSLEKGMLLKKFPDPRIHFALVPAARGAPRLQDDPYRGVPLEQELEDHVASSLISPNLVQVDAENGVVYLSQLFKWYQDEIIAAEGSLISFVNRHRSSDIPETYRVAFLRYDWALNGKDSDE
jgi:Protein of unknown function, DUF547